MQRRVLLCIFLVQFGMCLSLGNAAAVKFKDCNHVRAAGFVKNQTYTVWMNDTTSFRVLIHCRKADDRNIVYGHQNMSAELIDSLRTWSIKSHAVILVRFNGTENFNRTWQDYQRGFGNPDFNHWLGLDKIHYLTRTGYNIFPVYLFDWYAVSKVVRYFHFNVSSSPNFQLSIRDYLGQVPDDLLYNNGMNFATYDKNDYNDCAKKLRAGWWYNDCTYALPTGVYYPGGDYSPKGGFHGGMFWKDWRGYGYSLKAISMFLSTSV